jgi:hypothetical protein
MAALARSMASGSCSLGIEGALDGVLDADHCQLQRAGGQLLRQHRRRSDRRCGGDLLERGDEGGYGAGAAAHDEAELGDAGCQGPEALGGGD